MCSQDQDQVFPISKVISLYLIPWVWVVQKGLLKERMFVKFLSLAGLKSIA